MSVEVTALVTAVASMGGSVAAIGGARLGVQALIKAYRYLVDQLGYSPADAMRIARQNRGDVSDVPGANAHLRQGGKDEEARVLHESRSRR